MGIVTLDSAAPETRHVSLGFVPLTDCAPLAVAAEKGWFRQYGLDVQLSREPSWANIRDKVAVGALDGAQMLAALPFAMTLGLGGLAAPTEAVMVLNLNGNAVTVSNALWEAMAAAGGGAPNGPVAIGGALRRAVEARRATGEPPLTFGIVFPWSSHNYLLRYWLAASGIDPDRDVRLVTLPPPRMVANLAARRIDGFCAGAPYGHRAADLGIGRTAILTADVWHNHPEKVLGVSAAWAAAHPRTLRALIAALIEACRWLDMPENRDEAVRIVASRAYVDMPEAIVASALPHGLAFHRGGANFPWISQAAWTLAQMRRWDQIGANVDIAATAAAVYRPGIYRSVAAALGLACPAVDGKVEGMPPDGFVDGRTFDTHDIDAFLARLPAFPAAGAAGTPRYAS